MLYQRGRYSWLITPIAILFDTVVILSLAYAFFFERLFEPKYHFFIYIILSWFIISRFTNFYGIYRHTKFLKVVSRLLQQTVLFTLSIFTFFGITRSVKIGNLNTLLFILSLLASVLILKLVLFFLLKHYRIVTGSNYRNVIIIGSNKRTEHVKALFEKRKDYGYICLGFFSDKINSLRLGTIDNSFDFVIEENVDEIYCSVSELSDDQLKKFINFSEKQRVNLKFIPDTREIYGKNLQLDYYDFSPILTLKESPLDDPINKILKRVFDIGFSSFIIIFILSWLTPILAILIKLESKGSIFYKQGRPGFKEQEFFCFKFRSMKETFQNGDKLAVKNDPRVTQIGRFLRRTSIDEMPQFFNVFLGDMSVVGPRPPIWSQNKKYRKKIDKYLERHFVKPGITGLAQAKGFRGEIETEDEIVNRIKYDIFYIENWSLFLDLKIVYDTILNVFKGQEKAY